MYIKQIFSIIISVFFITDSLNAQVNEYVSAINAFEDSRKLKNYLLKNDLIAPNRDTTIVFHAGRIKVDLYEKNLFGNEESEIVLHISDQDAHSLNFFYKKNGKYIKVPGQVSVVLVNINSHFANIDFKFEDIFKPGEYALLKTYGWGYARSVLEENVIYRIEKDTIHEVYKFSSKYSSYSGLMTYFYNTKVEYSFVLSNDKHPKVLVKEVTFQNERNESKTDGRGTLSGYIEEGSYIEKVFFESDSVNILKENLNAEYVHFLNSIDGIENLNIEKCSSNTVLYLADEFIWLYFLNPKKIPVLTTYGHYTDGVRYLECCKADITNRQLKVEVLDTSTGAINTMKFDLKPLLTDFVKGDFDPSRLYFFTNRYRSWGHDPLRLDTIIYFKPEAKINLEQGKQYFNFADESFTYYANKSNGKIWAGFTNSKLYFAIDLDKLKPFFKQEFIDILVEDANTDKVY